MAHRPHLLEAIALINIDDAFMAARVSRECAELIDFQSGVLARWQAADSAADLRAIQALLHSGRWQTLYGGVYAAFTGPPSRESVLWAAVRRCGSDAILSHFTAAELDGLADQQRDVIHVTIPTELRIRLSSRDRSESLPCIVVHRSIRVAMARHPARTPPRTRIAETVLDLTELARTFDGAFGWLSMACGRRLVTPDQLRAAAAWRAKMRWRADVEAATEEIAEGVHSNLEHGFVMNVERPHRLPTPKRQFRKRQGNRPAYLDNLYDDLGVGVELDGLASHPPEARWLDMRRDNYFASAGIITLRYSWADIAGRPCQVAREIGLVLRRRGWTGSIRPCGASCAARAP
jgi:very-short-patch-repair endonuclease